MKLAVCLVVCDSEGSIFLTLRSRGMRVFPNSWVLPGGHIDPGESLEEGVIRELFEETGVEIRPEKDGSLTYKEKLVDLKPFFAFESSIPSVYRDKNNRAKLDLVNCPMGHLIVYFYVRLGVPSSEISVNLCEREVAACVWLSPSQMQSVLNSDSTTEDDTVDALKHNGSVAPTPLKMFYPYFPNKHKTGIGKASTFALRHLCFLETY